MNSIAASAVAIREDASQYLIRYGIDHQRFAQVLSSVTSRSVLLLGVPCSAGRESGSTEPEYSLIAVISLTAPVDPDQTSATFEGSDLVLRLVKSEDRRLEETLIPVNECPEACACEP